MLAEGVGFEPTIPVKVCQFSRLVLSSTLPTLLYVMNSKANHLSDNTHFISLCGESAIFGFPMKFRFLQTKGHGTSLLGSKIGMVGSFSMALILLVKASISISEVKDSISS